MDDDTVDLWGGTVALSNMAGFAPRTVVSALTFVGGPGDDKFVPPVGRVALPAPGATPTIRFFGGSGNDTMSNLGDPEGFWGDVGNDKVVIGTATAFGLVPGGGDDVLIGGLDYFNKASDTDTIFGGPGNDIIAGGFHGSTLDGGSGRDSITGYAGNDTIHGGSGNDTIDGGGGRDRIYGDGGDDTINGGAGDDYILGGDGDDTINTGPSGVEGLLDEDGGGSGTWYEVAYGEDGWDSIDASQGGSALLQGDDGQDTVLGSLLGTKSTAALILIGCLVMVVNPTRYTVTMATM